MTIILAHMAVGHQWEWEALVACEEAEECAVGAAVDLVVVEDTVVDLVSTEEEDEVF